MHLIKGKHHISHSAAIILMVLTALLWSLGGLLIKMVNINPLAITGIRSLIGCIFLLALIRRPHFTWSFPQIAGAVAFAGTVTTFVAATRMTTAANAILLQYSAPVYVSLLGLWLLKERVRFLDILTLLVVLGGMVLFFLDGLQPGGLAGNIFGVISGVSFACFFVFTRMQKEGSPIETVLLGNILAALIGVPFAFAQWPDTTGWIVLVVLGIVQLGLPYILYSIAIRHITALEAILTCTMEPVLNPLWVWLAIGEMPGKWAIAGGAIVVIAVTVRSIIASRTNGVKV